jgi:hypothetical protein
MECVDNEKVDVVSIRIACQSFFRDKQNMLCFLYLEEFLFPSLYGGFDILNGKYMYTSLLNDSVFLHFYIIVTANAVITVRNRTHAKFLICL